MVKLSKIKSKDTIDELIKSFFTEHFDDNKAEVFAYAVHYQEHDFRLNHSPLTEYVYSHYDDVKRSEDGSTKVLYWENNVEALKKYTNSDKFQSNNSSDEEKKEISELPSRMSDNIKLAVLQYKNFIEKLDEANDNLKKVNEDYKKSSRKLNDASVKLDKSSSDFISMLGVFSALIFGVFGGFDAFKSIFSNINKASVTMVIINSSILMIGLIILIFLLIQSISILSGRTFLACGCKNTSVCGHEFYERYPLFSFSIGLFLFILVLGLVYGVVYRAGVKMPYNLDLKQVLFYIGVVFLGVVFLGVVFIGFLPVKICKNIKKRNKDSLRKNEKSTD